MSGVALRREFLDNWAASTDKRPDNARLERKRSGVTFRQQKRGRMKALRAARAGEFMARLRSATLFPTKGAGNDRV